MLNKALEKKKGVHTWSQLFAEFFQSHGPSPCLVSPYTSSPMLASCQPVGHEYRYIFTLSSLKVFVLQTSACIHSSSVLLCNLHEIYTYWIPNCSSSVIPLASFGSNFALMNMQFKSAYTLDTQMLVSLSLYGPGVPGPSPGWQTEMWSSAAGPSASVVSQLFLTHQQLCLTAYEK